MVTAFEMLELVRQYPDRFAISELDGRLIVYQKNPDGSITAHKFSDEDINRITVEQLHAIAIGNYEQQPDDSIVVKDDAYLKPTGEPTTLPENIFREVTTGIGETVTGIIPGAQLLSPVVGIAVVVGGLWLLLKALK